MESTKTITFDPEKVRFIGESILRPMMEMEGRAKNAPSIPSTRLVQIATGYDGIFEVVIIHKPHSKN